MKNILAYFPIGLLVLGSAACTSTNHAPKANVDYGVFLSLEGEAAVEASEGYELAIIDAQQLTANEIAEMKDRGQTVFSYLNIGSLETFRSYYEAFQDLTLEPYDNWEDEFWIAVSDEHWQEFVVVSLANELLEKGIDGFWVDNVDVYGQFPTKEMYDGVENSLKTLMGYGKPVIINGGDQFVQTFLERNQQVDDILTGVNQETVFSGIDFEGNTLGTQIVENQKYYLNYLNKIEKAGKDIFLLEYTADRELTEKIHNYAVKRGWKYYVSDSIELDESRNH